MNMGLFPRKLVMVGLVWGLVESSSPRGRSAFVYKEAESSSLSTGRALLSGTPAPQR
jgi:hypothetical protein